MPFSTLKSTGDVANDVSTFLTQAGKTGTVKHISEVVAEARRLAEHYGADVEAAAVAAWCHDLATVVPRDAWIAQAEQWGAAITSSDRAIQMLLHGPIAAEVVRQKLGITDENLLNAIRHHSTLRAGASQIETIVFTADKIALDPTSPVSDFVPVIKQAFADGAPLEELAFTYLDWVVKNGPDLGWTVHERVQAAWEDLNQQGIRSIDAMASATIHDHTIPSNAIGSVMNIRVVTPPHYDPAQTYPVVYLLHMWGRTERYWTDRLNVDSRLAEGVLGGWLPPMILALPQGDKSFYINAADPPGFVWEDSPLNDADEYYHDGYDSYGAYGDYLLREAIPFVEETYPVRQDREGRAIGGLSMGAAGSAVHAFVDPDRFSAVGLHAPAVFYNEDGPGAPPWIFGVDDVTAFEQRDPVALVERFVTPQNQPRIWIDCGWDDPLRQGINTLHQFFLARGIAHDYHLWPGGHDGPYWAQHVDDYLRFYARLW